MAWKDNNWFTRLKEYNNVSLENNPVAYFDAINWTIPEDKYYDIINTLFSLMSTDSNPVNGQVGKEGLLIYKICQKLASNKLNPQFTNDWNYALKVSKSMNESKLREGSLSKKLITIALIGTLAASSAFGAYNPNKKSNNKIETSITQQAQITNPQDYIAQVIIPIINAGNKMPTKQAAQARYKSQLFNAINDGKSNYQLSSLLQVDDNYIESLLHTKIPWLSNTSELGMYL